MLRNAVCRAVKIRNGVALLTAVLVRLRYKLVIVSVFVAIRAGREFYFVDRRFAGRRMALGTIDPGVRALKRVFRRRMLLDVKERGLPAVDRMTFRAFSL